jgi:hypothetical protein
MEDVRSSSFALCDFFELTPLFRAAAWASAELFQQFRALRQERKTVITVTAALELRTQLKLAVNDPQANSICSLQHHEPTFHEVGSPNAGFTA